MGSKKELGKVRRAWAAKIERPYYISRVVKDYHDYVSSSRGVTQYHRDGVVAFARGAISRWRSHHETVYTVDPDLMHSLIASGLPDRPIPVDVLRRIPHQTPLIVLNEPILMADNNEAEVAWSAFVVDHVAGALVENGESINFEDGRKPPFSRYSGGLIEALRIVWFGIDTANPKAVVVSTMTVPMGGNVEICGLEGDTVDLAKVLNGLVSDPNETVITNEWPTNPGDPTVWWVKTNETLFPFTTGIILYLCSEEPDMKEVALPKGTSRAKVPRGDFESFDVGMRIGAALRRSRSKGSHSPSTGTGRPMAPHIRRGHWHRFWTGPRDGERKVVIRWLPPIPVNLDKGIVISTVHPVVKETDAA